ncbi:hypothetical protein L1049_001547 [Liquidambar formosana]|uniref:Uncharacterized protein n=1 Tax=Liquidambar formosana TaxID=63359 RepID=A0AAP0NEG1_LIQFO
MNNIFKISALLILLFPTIVLSECTCDEEATQSNRSEALKYKLAAIASILVCGAIGVTLPLLGKKIRTLSPENDIFFMVKAFAAGVILSTGFIHILPDAFSNLTSPCLKENPWGRFPFTGFVAMMASVGTLMVDSFATGYYKRMHYDRPAVQVNADEEHAGHVPVHTHATHGHSHGSSAKESAPTSELIRHRIISQVLELGIVVHSVIIGISLGASESPATIKPLLAALSFHQFFEGMGLGGCISQQAKFKSRSMAIMALCFSLTTPVGIAIGLGVSHVYKENSPTALIVEGNFNAAAAGILIYMALVDLLAADFMNPKMQTNVRLLLGAYISLLLGAGCMSISALLILLFPTIVLSECTCDEDATQSNKSEALKYKLVAIASILVCGAIGVTLPLLGKKIRTLRPENDIFFMVKAFAAGVILSTGFIHILPDAFSNLTSPCLKENPWGRFPFTGFVAMMASVGTLMVDSFATGYYKRMHYDRPAVQVNADEEHAGHVHVHTHATHSHSHGSSAKESAPTSELIRHRIISQVLELGIVVHSVIIGISLGASESPATIKPLLAALSFHQFFEGMGLGGCISQAKFKSRSMAIMALCFSLTTPVGIAIGLGVSNVYKENSPTALIVEGNFNAAAAGILIYMALVDLLAADFMNSKMQTNVSLLLGAYISLLLGAGCMSALAKWA